MSGKRDGFDRLPDFLVEDILETSDEQIIADAIEDGEDPEAIAEHGRKLLDKVIASIAETPET